MAALQKYELKNSYDASVYGKHLVNCIAQFQNGQPDAVTQLLLTDIANPMFVDELRQHAILGKVTYRPRIKGKNPWMFQQPFLFTPRQLTSHSKIEQLLFGWLMAWLAIQPSDIAKLKTNHFAQIKNQAGRTTDIFVEYFKGRSGSNHSTRYLSMNEIEGRAIQAYLKSIPANRISCFDSKTPIRFKLSFNINCLPRTLVDLWRSPALQTFILEQLYHRKASPLFLDLMFALQQDSGQSYNSWSSRQLKQSSSQILPSYEHYFSSVTRPLNPNTINYGHIKTSAIHSRSDHYRESDLINHNSHTSNTEKISYLTDENQEWINQNGRISRLVLHDMQCFVYQQPCPMRNESEAMSYFQ